MVLAPYIQILGSLRYFSLLETFSLSIGGFSEFNGDQHYFIGGVSLLDSQVPQISQMLFDF